MKSFLLAGLLISTAFAGKAQSSTPSGTSAVAAIPRTEEYCEVNALQKINGKVVVSIDYGQQRKLLALNLFRDESGKAMEFNSVVDALNWLNAQGWEFVNAYTVADKSYGTSHYVMRRRARS